MLTRIFSSKKQQQKTNKKLCIEYYVGGESWFNVWIIIKYARV